MLNNEVKSITISVFHMLMLPYFVAAPTESVHHSPTAVRRTSEAVCSLVSVIALSRPREECERFDWSRAGKMWPIFPGTDLSVLIGREAIFADREASRDASLNAPFFPRAAPSDTPLGAGGVAYIFPWDLRKRRIFNLGLKP